MFEFEPVVPIGARTSADLPHKRGEVHNIWLDSDVDDYKAEDAALAAGRLDPAVTRAQHLDILGILRSLKARAARGQLRVVTDAQDPAAQAKVMTRVPFVIELRPKFSRGGARPSRIFRLYYVEPVRHPSALLPLVLSTKPDGDDTHGEQNRSIDDAQARGRAWQLMDAMKGQ